MKPQGLLGGGGGSLLLSVLAISLSANGYEEACSDQKAQPPGAFDPNVFGNLAGAQIFHASVDDVFPTNPFLSLSPPNFKRTRLGVCLKRKIATCMYYGNSSNNLPERLQGIWWIDGIKEPSQLYSTAGTWDPRTRKLVMSSFDVRTRGFDGTSSVQKNGTWTVSGASVYNQYLFLGAYYEIYYNEDLTAAQWVEIFTIAGLRVPIPLSVINTRYTWIGQDSWKGETSTFNTPSALGDVVLRRAVNGNGRPGLYFDDFIEARPGIHLVVPIPA